MNGFQMAGSDSAGALWASPPAGYAPGGAAGRPAGGAPAAGWVIRVLTRAHRVIAPPSAPINCEHWRGLQNSWPASCIVAISMCEPRCMAPHIRAGGGCDRVWPRAAAGRRHHPGGGPGRRDPRRQHPRELRGLHRCCRATPEHNVDLVPCNASALQQDPTLQPYDSSAATRSAGCTALSHCQQRSADGASPLQGILEVLATDGDSELGGDDFDRAVALWALDACRRKGHAAG